MEEKKGRRVCVLCGGGGADRKVHKGGTGSDSASACGERSRQIVRQRERRIWYLCHFQWLSGPAQVHHHLREKMKE